MRFLLFLVPVALLAQSTTSSPKPAASKPSAPRGSARTPVKPSAPALNTGQDRIIYALGLSIARSLSQFDLSPQELAIVQRGLTDGAAGKPAEELSTWGPKISGFAQDRAVQFAAKEQEKSNAYLVKAAAQPGAVKTASGLIYREITPGTGPSPQATDTVKVNYRGTLVDGTEFDSSYKRNEPATFTLNSVIPCWTEGLQKMKVGGKAQLVCPASIAYGPQGRPGIPGNAALIFEVELLDIPAAAPAPGTPAPPRPPAPPQGR